MSNGSPRNVRIDILSSPKAQLRYRWSKSESRHWSIVLFIGTVALYAARIALPICATTVGHRYDWSKTDSGTVLSSFFWGYAATQIIGGWLADQLGGERVVTYTTLVWALLTLFTPPLFALSYYLSDQPLKWLVMLRVATGFCQGVHFPCMASLTSQRLSNADKSRVFGFVMAGSHAGSILCGSFGSLILDRFGWEAVFYFIGAISLLWWLYFYNLSKEARLLGASSVSSMPLISLNSAPSLLTINNGAVSSGRNSPLSPDGPGSVPWKRLLEKPAFWAAVCAHYVGANAFYTLFSWMPSYFSENFPEAKGWVFNVLPNVAVFMTSATSPWIASRMIHRRIETGYVRKLMEGISLCGIGICLLAASRASNYYGALLCLTLGLWCRGFHHGGVAVNPQDFAPNHVGAVFGVQNTAGAIPGFVGVFVAGYILEATNSWGYVFSVTAVQCFAGAVIYSLFGTGKQII